MAGAFDSVLSLAGADCEINHNRQMIACFPSKTRLNDSCLVRLHSLTYKHFIKPTNG
jgi:hypothetical protein